MQNGHSYPTKDGVPMNSPAVSVTAAIGIPSTEISCPYPNGNDTDDTSIYIDDEMVQFPENIMYMVSLHGPTSCIQDITWIKSSIFADKAQDSKPSSDKEPLFDRIGSVNVAKVKVGEYDSLTEDSDAVEDERWYVLGDGTPFHDYQKCMRNEDEMKDWWTSNNTCREMEKKDMRYYKSLGVRFTADHIPTPESLSRKDIGVVYRGEPTKYYVPVYSKSQDNRALGCFLYRHIWTRTLLKYRAYYRIISDDDREMYMYGGYHVYFRSGRRLIGNPWHNRIPNQYVLGIPYGDGDLQKPWSLWQWYFDRTSNKWVNIPFYE